MLYFPLRTLYADCYKLIYIGLSMKYRLALALVNYADNLYLLLFTYFRSPNVPPMPKKKECSFLLKQPKSTTPTPINFHMTCPDGDVKRGIGKKILPADWDFASQRASGGGKTAREVNQLIALITGSLPGLKSECQRKGRVISCADIHAALDVILQDKRPETPKARDMFDDFRAIIEDMKAGKVLTPGKDKKRYSLESINNFDKTLRKLELFYLGSKRGTAYDLVTMDTYHAFITWCHTDKQSNSCNDPRTPLIQ